MDSATAADTASMDAFCEDYQCKVIKLLSLRFVRQNVLDFWGDRSSFDDYTIHLRETHESTSLIQIKHQANSKNITSEELLSDDGEFSLSRYFTSLTGLKVAASDLVILTNRGLNKCRFLARNQSKSFLNISPNDNCMYKVDFRSFCEAKKQNVDPDFRANIYLLVEQKPFDLNAQIEVEIEELVKECRLILVDVKATAEKFGSFVTEWGPRGCLHLCKQHVVAKLCEEFLFTYKVDTNGACGPERTTWDDISCDKIVTWVEINEEVLTFLKRCDSNRKDGSPLLLKINSEQDYEAIKRVSDRFGEDFRVIVMSKWDIDLPLDLDVKCFATLSDLNGNDRDKILNREVKLQGRATAKLRTLVSKPMYKYVRCRDVIRILLRGFSIGYCYERVPDYYIDRNLEPLLDYKSSSGILSASSGSGKSTYLNFMANQAPSSVWVLKVDLNNRITFEKLMYIKEARDFLKYFHSLSLNKYKCSNIQLAGAVFDEMVKNKAILLLVDGFNEVPPPCQEAVVYMAKCLRREGYQVWLTTCPQEQSALERNLDAPTVTLDPFTPEMQRNFLRKYIMQLYEAGSDTEELVKVSLKVKSTFDDTYYIATPLLLKLITDAVHDEAENLNASNLWRKFHTSRVEALRYEYSHLQNLPQFFDKHYKRLALTVVFHKYALSGLNVFKRCQHFLKNDRELVQVLLEEGFISLQSGKFDAKFAHYTLAEYLAALWLVENLHSDDKATRRVVRCLTKQRFQHVLHYKRFFKMFDVILAQKHGSSSGRTVLHMAALHGDIEVITQTDSADELRYSALDYALGNGHLALADKICEKLGVTHMSIDIEPLLLPFYFESCVSAGLDCLIKVLFKYFVCLKLLKKEIKEGRPLKLCYELEFDGYVEEKLSAYVKDLGVGSVSDFLLKANVKSNDGYYYDLRMASAFGTEENLSSLLNSVEVNSMDNSLYPPLHCAVMHGRPKNVALLLAKGVEIDTVGINGNTALHVAIKHDQAVSLYALLSHGANVNKQNDDGDAPLHYAFKHEKPHLVEALLPIRSSIEADLQNSSGDTPMLLALMHGKIKMAETLLRVYQADASLENYEGYSCVHYAARTGAARFITSRTPSINGRDKDGNTPLLIALKSGHLNIARSLLGQGADITIENNDGYSCLHFAAKAGAYDIVLRLTSSGLDVNKPNNHQESPLLLAFRHLQLSTVRLLLARSSYNDIDDNGNSYLHYTASLDEVDAAAALIDKGLDINKQNNDGDTPLLLALQRKHITTAKLLLGNGADVNVENSSGNSCLHYAVAAGDTDVVLRLMDQGLDANKRNKNGETSAFLAFKYSRCSTMKLHLVKSVRDVRDEHGNGCLHYAAQQGEAVIVHELIDRGVDVNQQNSNGETPLLLALKNRHVNCSKLLLSSGTNVHLEDNSGCSCLHYAALAGDNETVLTCIDQGLDVNKLNDEGHAPLFLAIINNRQSTKKLLLDKGTDIDAVCNKDHSCLHQAARAGADDIVLSLLKQGLDINHADKDGYTPLLGALDAKMISTAKLLLSKNANVNMATSALNSCLHYAAKAGFDGIVLCLIGRSLDINKQNANRDTPLSLALEHENITTAKILRENGASIDVKNRYGCTCLHLASEAGDDEFVLELVTKGVNVNQRNNSGETPLFHAIRRKHINVTRTLLANGADVRLASVGEENTCLHYAAEVGFEAIVLELVNKGANVNSKNCKEETPIRLALLNGHIRTVDLLLSRGAIVGDNFLCLASGSGDYEVLTKLPSLNCTKPLLVDKELDYKRTMLHYSIRDTCYSERDVQRQLKTVKLILNKGADVNMQDLEGNTALHCASKRIYYKNTAEEYVPFTKSFHVNVAKLLLDKGADVTLKNSCGNTALDLAINRENAEIIALIQQKIKSSRRYEGSAETGLVLHTKHQYQEASRCSLF